MNIAVIESLGKLILSLCGVDKVGVALVNCVSRLVCLVKLAAFSIGVLAFIVSIGLIKKGRDLCMYSGKSSLFLITKAEYENIVIFTIALVEISAGTTILCTDDKTGRLYKFGPLMLAGRSNLSLLLTTGSALVNQTAVLVAVTLNLLKELHIVTKCRIHGLLELTARALQGLLTILVTGSRLISEGSKLVNVSLRLVVGCFIGCFVGCLGLCAENAVLNVFDLCLKALGQHSAANERDNQSEH